MKKVILTDQITSNQIAQMSYQEFDKTYPYISRNWYYTRIKLFRHPNLSSRTKDFLFPEWVGAHENQLFLHTPTKTLQGNFNLADTSDCIVIPGFYIQNPSMNIMVGIIPYARWYTPETPRSLRI